MIRKELHMKDYTIISFPGLGIEPFRIDKVAFSIGKLEVRWYGIILTLGIVLAFVYACTRAKRTEHILADDIIDVGLLTVPMGIIGARIYYVLTTLDEYSYDSFYDVIAIWEGGIAIYGAIIGGFLGILIMCRIKRLSWRKLLDLVAPGVMLAQAVGRWGNFCNGEAYGYPIGETTTFHLLNAKYTLQSGEGSLFRLLRMGLGDGFYYHPTFFYESVWNLVGFVLINLFYKHKKYDGQIVLMYVTWYGFGRLFIEGLRTDSLYLPGTALRISQCLGLACFVLGLAALFGFGIANRLGKKKDQTI